MFSLHLSPSQGEGIVRRDGQNGRPARKEAKTRRPTEHHSEALAPAATATLQERAMSTDTESRSRPTIVLVHGAFAESASWNGAITV